MRHSSTNISRRFAMTLCGFALALVSYRTDLTLAVAALIASPLPLLMLLMPAKPPVHDIDGRPTDGWFETHEWYEPTAADQASQECQDGQRGCCGPRMSPQDFADLFERRRQSPARPPTITLAEAETILGIADGFSPSQARAAYRDAAMRTHPDQGGDHEDFLKVQAAWECARASYS